jgi:hypothetical protein
LVEHVVQLGAVAACPGGGFLEDAAAAGVVESLGLRSIALLVKSRCSSGRQDARLST